MIILLLFLLNLISIIESTLFSLLLCKIRCPQRTTTLRQMFKSFMVQLFLLVGMLFLCIIV